MFDEEKFAAELGARMEAESAGIQAATNLGRQVERRLVRQAWVTRSALGLTVVALGIGTGIVVTQDHPGAAGRSGQVAASQTVTRGSGSAAVHDVGYVTTRTSEALANISDYMVYVHSMPGNGLVSESWQDEKTGQARLDSNRADGSRLYSIGIPATDRVGAETIVVDFEHQAWWTYQTPDDRAAQGGGKAKFGLFEDPAEISDALTKGALNLVGEEQINGQNVLHLQVALTKGSQQSVVDLWVDQKTYLPVRNQYKTAGKGSNAITVVVDYQWLPRTTANLAQLTVTPPAGFTKSDQPITPSDGPGVG